MPDITLYGGAVGPGKTTRITKIMTDAIQENLKEGKQIIINNVSSAILLTFQDRTEENADAFINQYENRVEVSTYTPPPNNWLGIWDYIGANMYSSSHGTGKPK